MHALVLVFLALYLAHLLTDFVLQSDRTVAEKTKGRLLGYAKHGGVHYATAWLVTGLVSPSLAKSWTLYTVILGLTLVHLSLDWGKLLVTGRGGAADGAGAFVLDQVLHLVTVVVASWLVVRTPMGELVALTERIQAYQSRVLVLFVVYCGVVFGGGCLVRYLTKPLLKAELVGDETTTQLQNAGMYIGWLERFLVLTALLLQSPATVGLILTAKSIARYPELKSIRFAEYFLIGTLLSISMGILGGILLVKVFYGTVVLSR